VDNLTVDHDLAFAGLDAELEAVAIEKASKK